MAFKRSAVRSRSAPHFKSSINPAYVGFFVCGMMGRLLNGEAVYNIHINNEFNLWAAKAYYSKQSL